MHAIFLRLCTTLVQKLYTCWIIKLYAIFVENFNLNDVYFYENSTDRDCSMNTFRVKVIIKILRKKNE